jgi:hypothetical protein
MKKQWESLEFWETVTRKVREINNPILSKTVSWTLEKMAIGGEEELHPSIHNRLLELSKSL